MPTVDPVDFTRLAEAISDGDAVDWAAAGSQASPSDRRVLDALKVVSEIAGLHRTIPPSAGERPAELYAGDVWSHLTLREVIGRGAYGVVYRAWDPQLDREVALKLISESAQRDQAMIVVDEGRLLAKVRHRGVVTVFGAARAAGFAGLWMELIQGATFEEIIQQQGRFSAREAALFGAEVCEALAAVHSAGLLHRDVKAQNVMRDRSGRVVLMDFGTGRLREIPDEAAVADLAGTPLYMAPELFWRRRRRRTDATASASCCSASSRAASRRRPARSPRSGQRRTAPSGCVTSARSGLGLRRHRRARAVPRPAHRYTSAGELSCVTGFATSADTSTDRRTDPAACDARRERRARSARRADLGRSPASRLAAVAMLAVGVAAGVAGRGRGCRRACPPCRPCAMMTPPGTEDFLSFRWRRTDRRWPSPPREAVDAAWGVEARPVADSAGAHDPFWSMTAVRSPTRQNALWVTGIGGANRFLCPSWNAMAAGAPTAPFSSPPTSAGPSTASRRPAASGCPSACRASTAPTCAGRRSYPARRRSSTRRAARRNSRA